MAILIGRINYLSEIYKESCLKQINWQFFVGQDSFVDHLKLGVKITPYYIKIKFNDYFILLKKDII